MYINRKVLVVVGIIVALVVVAFLAMNGPGSKDPNVVLSQDEINAAAAAKANQDIPAGTYLSFAMNEPHVTGKLQRIGATDISADVTKMPSGPGDTCTIKISFKAEDAGQSYDCWLEVYVQRGPNGELAVKNNAKMKGSRRVFDEHLY